MSSITIFDITSNQSNEVKYEQFEDTIESLLKKYDPNLDLNLIGVSFGSTRFFNFKTKIHTCLNYGESLAIHNYEINITIKTDESSKFKIKFDSQKSLRTLIKRIGDFYDNYDFKLLSSGVNLRDKDTSKPIKTYLTSKDSLIEIVFDESLKEIKKGEYLINVKIDNKDPFEIYVRKNMTIKELRNILDIYEFRLIKPKMLFLDEILKEEKTIGDYIIEPNDMIIVESFFQDNLQKFKNLPRAFQCNKTVSSTGFFDTFKSFFSLTPLSTLGRLESGVIGFPDVGGFGFPTMKEHLEDWRVAKAGLCLEGKCENSKCKAFNEMVIMNMGVPYIHHVGMIFNKKETKCPQCESYVKATTCAFNNCKWRFSGILVSKDGPARVRSDWKIVENEYYKFSDDENSKVDWYSLTIETNLPDNHIKINNQLTQDICAICYDVFHDVAKKLKCNHIFHIDCFEQLVKNNGINTKCPLCRGIVD